MTFWKFMIELVKDELSFSFFSFTHLTTLAKTTIHIDFCIVSKLFYYSWLQICLFVTITNLIWLLANIYKLDQIAIVQLVFPTFASGIFPSLMYVRFFIDSVFVFSDFVYIYIWEIIFWFSTVYFFSSVCSNASCTNVQCNYFSVFCFLLRFLFSFFAFLFFLASDTPARITKLLQNVVYSRISFKKFTYQIQFFSPVLPYPYYNASWHMDKHPASGVANADESFIVIFIFTISNF